MADPTPPIPAAAQSALGLTPADYAAINKMKIAAQGGGGTFQPWALGSNVETGTLWLGTNPAQAAVYGPGSLNAKNLAAGAGTTVTFRVPGMNVSRQVLLQGLNLHNGYTASMVMSDDNRGQIISSNQIKHIGIGVQIKDPQGKVVHTEWISDQDKNNVMGFTGGLPDDWAAWGGKSTGKGPDVVINLNSEQIAQSTAAKHAVGASDKTGTIAEQLQSLYKMPQPALQAMKHELWAAGYYGSKPLDQVDMTTITNDDITGFGSLMMAAARYYAAGTKVTWQDLLSKQANSGAVNAARHPHVKLSDPAAIIQEADATATKILGRGPKPEDIQAILGMVQSNEQGRFDQSQATQSPYIATDPQADIEQFFRQKYPNEANAADWGDRAMQWEQMSKQPSPAPSPVQPTVPGAV